MADPSFAFTPEQLREAYDRYAQSRWPSDAHRQAAAMDLLGPDAEDDAIERLAAEIGRAFERKEYNALVMQAFDDIEHVDRREFRERRAVVERAARKRL